MDDKTKRYDELKKQSDMLFKKHGNLIVEISKEWKRKHGSTDDVFALVGTAFQLGYRAAKEEKQNG